MPDERIFYSCLPLWFRCSMTVRDEGDNRMTYHHSTTGNGHASRPLLDQHGQVIWAFGTLQLLPIALTYEARLHKARTSLMILCD